MTEKTLKAAELMDMLPVKEQDFAYEFIRRLVLAWDPDFTKLTPAEAKDLQEASAEYERGEYVSF